MTIKEGPNLEPGYYFPADEIHQYMDIMEDTDFCDNQFLEPLRDKLLIMTHDDEFCPKMHEIERQNSIESTWFLLADRLEKDIPDDIDIQLHFNKEVGTIGEQVGRFFNRFGRRPIFNRNHRLLWKSNNFDFPLLAMHGILADSTLIGASAYLPCIGGKIIPIWELPFSISDNSQIFRALYNLSSNSKVSFRDSRSPIVVLAHPFAVCRKQGMFSCFQEVIELAQIYGYKAVSLKTFYDQYLKPVLVKYCRA